MASSSRATSVDLATSVESNNLSVDASSNNTEEAESTALVTSTESTRVHSDSGRPLVASDQILKNFRKMPAEIPYMIYAAMVNYPRLLRWDLAIDWRHTRLHDRHMHERSYLLRNCADLPPSLLLNKDAYTETKKHVNLVPQARVDNAHKFPWSYINPEFDVLYIGPYELLDHKSPCPDQVPGIRNIALEIRDLWTDEKVVLSPPRYKRAVENLASVLQKLPDVKRLLLIRDLSPLSRWGYHFGSTASVPREKLVPAIQQHHCGLGGVVNEGIENILSSLPAPDPDSQTGNHWQRPSKEVLEELTKALKVEMDNLNISAPKPLPRTSAIYSTWVDTNGRWQTIYNLT